MEKPIDEKDEAKEVSLKELIIKLTSWYSYILSKWITVVGIALICGILGIVVSLFTKPFYTAKTTFVLEAGEGSGGLGQYAGIASMVGIDLGGGGGGIFQGDNIMELYKSRNMIEKTLLSEVTIYGKKQLMVDFYLKINDRRRTWEKNPKLKALVFGAIARRSPTMSRLQDSILGAIVTEINKEYLVVSKPDKKLSIIAVDVKSSDEVFSKLFNDKIVENVNDFYIQTKTKKSIQNIGIIQSKVDSVSRMMNRAIYSSAEVADATLNLNPARQVQRVAPIQRSQVTAETNKAILSELVKSLELSKIALLKETPLIQVVDQPKLPLDKKGFGKTKGLILGTLLGGFLTVLVLTLKKIFNHIMV